MAVERRGVPGLAVAERRTPAGLLGYVRSKQALDEEVEAANDILAR